MAFFIRFKDFCYYNRKIICLVLFAFFVLLFFYFEFSVFSVDEEIVDEVVLKEKDEESLSSKEVFFIVDIKGAVNSPGTYEVSSEKRVMDVINMSGGLLDNADTTSVNLSKKVSDEMVIYIPFENEENSSVANDNGIFESIDYEDVVSDGKVSINTASLSELMTIKGIGEVKANAIIEYRNSNGAFSNIEDIKNVSGIGNSTFEKIKEYIKL